MEKEKVNRWSLEINQEVPSSIFEKSVISARITELMNEYTEAIDKRIEDRERIMAQIKDIAAENKDYRIWVENDGTDCHLHIDIKL